MKLCEMPCKKHIGGSKNKNIQNRVEVHYKKICMGLVQLYTCKNHFQVWQLKDFHVLNSCRTASFSVSSVTYVADSRPGWLQQLHWWGMMDQRFQFPTLSQHITHVLMLKLAGTEKYDHSLAMHSVLCRVLCMLYFGLSKNKLILKPG